MYAWLLKGLFNSPIQRSRGDIAAVSIYLSFLSLLILSQLIAQLFTVKQLSVITGKIADKQVSVTSHTGIRTRGTLNYSLILTLDNRKTYNIDYNLNDDFKLYGILNVGDSVKLYLPTRLYNYLSLDALNYGISVSQVEKNNVIVYSFKKRQRKDWPFIGFLFAAYIPAIWWLIRIRQNTSSLAS